MSEADAILKIPVGQFRRIVDEAVSVRCAALKEQRDKLVAACQRLLDCHDHGRISDQRDALKQIQEAVREAEAKQPKE